MAGDIKGITIEINGDTTNLGKALRDTNKESKYLKKELKDIERGLKLNPKNVELLEQKQRALGKEIANGKKRLDSLKQAESEAGKMGQEAFDKVRRELLKTQAEIERNQREFDELGHKIVKSGSKMDLFSQKIKSSASKVNLLGKGFNKLKQNASAITLGIAAIGGASSLSFGEVREGLNTVIKKTGATGESLNALKANYENVFKSVPDDATKVGEAIGEINTQFNATGEVLEKSAKLMLDFSRATEADVTQSTIQAKQVIEQFNLTANDLPSVLDAVTSAGQKTGLSVDKIFEAIVKGGPQFKSLGLDVAQSALLVGQFEQAGIDASVAIGSLSKAQVKFAQEGKSLDVGLKELQEKIKGTSNETEQLALASEIFGKKAPEMLNAIKSGKLDFEALANVASEASGSVEKTAAALLTPGEQIKQAFKGVMTEGGAMSEFMQGSVIPVVEVFASTLEGAIGIFNGLPGPVKTIIVTLVGFIAILTPLLAGIGMLSTGFSALGGAIGIGLGPLALLIAAIVAVIAIGVALYTHWDTIKAKASELWQKVKEVWDNITSWIGEAWGKAKEKTVEFFSSIKEKLSDWVSSTVDKVKEFGTNLVQGISNAITIAKAKAGEFLLMGALFVAKLILGVASKIFGIHVKLIEGIGKALSSAKNKALEFISVGWDMIKGIVKGITDKVGEVITAAKNMVKNAIFGARKEADSHSPSRVMIKEGHNFGDGFAVGIEDKKPLAEKKSREMVRGAINIASRSLQQGKKNIEKSLESLAKTIEKAQEKHSQTVGKIYEDLKKKESDLTKSYQDEVNVRTKTLSNWTDLFSEVPERQEVSGATLIANLKNQNAMFEEWQGHLQSIFNRGIDIELYDELKEKGLGAVDQLKALSEMSQKEWVAFQDEWRKRKENAKNQALIDLKPQFDKLQTDIIEGRKSAQKELTKAREAYKNEIEKIKEDAVTKFGNKQVIEKFISDVKDARKELSVDVFIPISEADVSQKVKTIVDSVISFGKTLKNKFSEHIKDTNNQTNNQLDNMAKDGKLKGVSFMEALISGIKAKQGEFFASIRSIVTAMDNTSPTVSVVEGVSWYAKGGIFKSPSVIGIGEAGQEAVLPINKLDAILASSLSKLGVGQSNYESDKLDKMIDLLTLLVAKESSIILDTGQIVSSVDKGIAQRRKLNERGALM